MSEKDAFLGFVKSICCCFLGVFRVVCGYSITHLCTLDLLEKCLCVLVFECSNC